MKNFALQLTGSFSKPKCIVFSMETELLVEFMEILEAMLHKAVGNICTYQVHQLFQTLLACQHHSSYIRSVFCSAPWLSYLTHSFGPGVWDNAFIRTLCALIGLDGLDWPHLGFHPHLLPICSRAPFKLRLCQVICLSLVDSSSFLEAVRW